MAAFYFAVIIVNLRQPQLWEKPSHHAKEPIFFNNVSIL